MKTLDLADAERITDILAEDICTLPANMLEKDIFVTEILRFLSHYDSPFPLVFCGGTCLSKAHKIIDRMSEDIDFKICLSDTGGTKSALKTALRTLKYAIAENFRALGFVFEESCFHSRNGNKYIRFDLPYASRFDQRTTSLRQVVQVEFTAQVLSAYSPLTVTSLIDEFLDNHSTDFTVLCVAVADTLAEKTVALLRRMGQRHGGFDPSTIRHLYDAFHILNKYPALVTPSLFAVCKEKIACDRRQFSQQSPEFSRNPEEFMYKVLQDMGTNPEYERLYTRFVGDVVYGQATPFAAAYSVFNDFASAMLEACTE